MSRESRIPVARSKYKIKPGGMKVEQYKDDVQELYLRTDKKTGRQVTNYLDWERKWRDVKITEYPAEFSVQLDNWDRTAFDPEAEMNRLRLEPELDYERPYWVPTFEQEQQLASIESPDQKTTAENRMYIEWRTARIAQNALIRSNNEIKRAKMSHQVKELMKRDSLVRNLIGSILADMTEESRRIVEAWEKVLPEGQEPDPFEAVNIHQARERGDWLFVFEAARCTHLLRGSEVDPILRAEYREQQKLLLSKLKHERGEFSKWKRRFDDQIKVCRSFGCVLDDELLCIYFMENLNDKIFSEVKANWNNLTTRGLFPQNYEALKSRVTEEYGLIVARKPGVVAAVIAGQLQQQHFFSSKEVSLPAREQQDHPRRCFVCRSGKHLYRHCPHFDSAKSLEENAERFRAQKLKEYGRQSSDSQRREPSVGDRRPKRGGKPYKRRVSEPRSSSSGAPGGDESTEAARYAMESDSETCSSASIESDENQTATHRGRVSLDHVPGPDIDRVHPAAVSKIAIAKTSPRRDCRCDGAKPPMGGEPRAVQEEPRDVVDRRASSHTVRDSGAVASGVSSLNLHPLSEASRYGKSFLASVGDRLASKTNSSGNKGKVNGGGAEEIRFKKANALNLTIKEQSLVTGESSSLIDLVYDTGTSSNLVPEHCRQLVDDIKHEDVKLLGVGGATVMTSEAGRAGVFGRARIVPGNGPICISQAQSGKFFQVINPNPNLFILRGWPGTIYKNREFYFERDFERYGDDLLHCMLNAKSEMALMARATFYNPSELPNPEVVGAKVEKFLDLRRLHEYFNHASKSEMKRLIPQWFKSSILITESDVDEWWKLEGDFCTGCLEGKMKEHYRRMSTKPLNASTPGEVGAADLMFIESRNDVKIPFLVHVDIHSKCIIGYALRNKTVGEAAMAIQHVLNQHKLVGQELKKLIFDRESSIVAMQDIIESYGVKLELKAAGQKVGVAEVAIRLIREKARSTKAGVRANYGYLPPSQFNVDLCLDSIAVLNRTRREGQDVSPYESFTGSTVDYERDLRCRWGEPVIVKKPKGITSDLTVTGEWAVVVRRLMNGTGVLKVYLVASKKYAYRLKFRRAKAPQWVIEALNGISNGAAIGLEDESDYSTESLAIQRTVDLTTEINSEHDLAKAIDLRYR